MIYACHEKEECVTQRTPLFEPSDIQSVCVTGEHPAADWGRTSLLLLPLEAGLAVQR